MERATLKETEIRPDNIQAEMTKCYSHDLSWILSRSDEFLDCFCPACYCEERLFLFTKVGFHYHVCGTCKTTYISPRPSPTTLTQFYSISEVYKLFLDKIFPTTQQIRREQFFRPRILRVIETCKTHGLKMPSLLEVGAGFGIFCDEAIHSNYFSTVVGIEPNFGLAKMCESIGLTVYNLMVEDARPDEIGMFDVVCSFEVLEHILEPHMFLNSCRRLLNQDGLLVLTCPNGMGFDLSVLGPLSDTYNFEHLNYFNPHSIRYFLEASGFQVLQVSTPGKLDVDLVRKAVIAGQLDLSNNQFLQRLLIDEFNTLGEPFQTFLSRNSLSGHMEIVAKIR